MALSRELSDGYYLSTGVSKNDKQRYVSQFAELCGLTAETLFEEIDSVPCIVYHEGAFGIEPITYVLTRTAVDAVETTAELIPE